MFWRQLISTPLLVVLIIALSLNGMHIPQCNAQAIRTVNGSVVVQIPGATLTLAATEGSSTQSSSTAFASTTDVNSAVANMIAQTQPQVRLKKDVCVFFFSFVFFII